MPPARDHGDASWHTDVYPELRSGPPWVMEEMIAAQPSLAAEMLERRSAAADEIAGAIDATLNAGRAVTIVGCGTSEHASHGIAALITAAVAPAQRPLIRARPALAAALDACDGICVAVSHDGETRATELAMTAAREAGARTVAITHHPSSSVAAAADRVLVTPRQDDSWCHTIGYTSPLLAGATIAGALGAVPAQAAAACDLLRHATSVDTASVAERLADRRVVLTAGAGIDHITARELALKIAEGARMPTISLELETVLHGQIAGHEPADALLLIAITDDLAHERLARRAGQVAQAAAAIGMAVAGLLSSRYDRALAPELTPAGRVVIDLPEAGLDPRLAGLLAGAGGLQTLTLQLAHARGTNPDLIRREEASHRKAAEVAGQPADW